MGGGGGGSGGIELFWTKNPNLKNNRAGGGGSGGVGKLIILTN